VKRAAHRLGRDIDVGGEAGRRNEAETARVDVEVALQSDAALLDLERRETEALPGQGNDAAV
jgi:hypothetical protein